MSEPKLIKGGQAVDDRGQLSFVNDFNFERVKRFYMIENHSRGFVRAWHGHKHEEKYFSCVHGSFLIGAVQIDDWVRPQNQHVHRYVLSSQSPSVLWIPAGYANGLMSLTENAKLIVYSTSTLQDSMNDDIRFPAHQWNPWKVEER